MKKRRVPAHLLLCTLLLAALPGSSPMVAAPPIAASAGPCWVRLNDAPTEYPSVQAAVDASALPGDLVKVAGYCAGVEQRAGLTQTVYLSKTLTIQGGYTITNWTAPDPTLHPTTLDAQGQGRVLLIAGDSAPTVSGLRLTGGDAGRAGYDPYGQGRGGGLYLFHAAAAISGCLFYGNTADSGGGIYTYDSSLAMQDSAFTGNTAPFFGGGLLMYGGTGRLEGNLFLSNTAGMGGGAYFGSDAITLTHNAFLSNTAQYEGGGVIVEIYGGHSELVGNHVAGNRAYFNGGGLYFGEEVRERFVGGAAPFPLISGSCGCALSAAVDFLCRGSAPAPRWGACGPPVPPHRTICGAGRRSGATSSPCNSRGATTIVLARFARKQGTGQRQPWLALERGSMRGFGGLQPPTGGAGGRAPLQKGCMGPGVTPNLPEAGHLNLTHMGQSPPETIRIAGGQRGDSLLLSGNLIAHNWTAGHGGGVYMGGDGGTAELVGNTVRENTAGGDGGGIYLDDSAEPTPILSNTVYLNAAGRNGGGIYLATTTATVRGNVVQGNRAGGDGGGGYGRGNWRFNTFSGNEAAGSGGGVFGGGVLVGNAVISNTAYAAGGGLYLTMGSTLAVENAVLSNQAADGGGIGLATSAITLTANLVSSNRAGKCGGGLALYQSAAMVQSNVVTLNEAGSGGGVCLDGGSDAVLINNWITENQVSSRGSGLLVIGSQLQLAHNTIARNAGHNGLYLWSSPTYTSAVVLTDTILVSHTVGLYVDAGNSARLEATLWGNEADWAGAGSIYTGTVNFWGPPGFLDPEAGDYHLGAGSAALDVGVDAGVTTDIDGDPRPLGAGYDIGADEAAARLALATYAAPDPVAAGNLLTYTLLLTNTGAISLHVVLSDTLPAHVTPTGVLTWNAALDPGGVWARTVVVTAAADYAGPLVNRLAAAAEEGAAGRAVVTVTAVVPILGLAAANDSPTALGRPTTLTATVAAGSGLTYTWSLGDGSFVLGPASFSHTYPAVGVYTAVVTAGNPVSTAAAGTIVEIVPGQGWRIYLPLVVRGLTRQ